MATRIILPPSVLHRTRDIKTIVAVNRLMGVGTLSRQLDVTPIVVHALAAHHGLQVSTINVEAVRNAPSTDQAYDIVHIKGRLPSTDPAVLGHLAGVAEMHMLTGDVTGKWKHAVAGSGAAAPDAYWSVPANHPLRRILGSDAIAEFDRGAYGPRVREAKLTAALIQRKPLIYGCPIPDRLVLVRAEAEQLQQKLRAQGRISPVARDLPILLCPTYWHVGSEVQS